MKAKDVPMLEKKILEILPTTQSEVWKVLGMDSRDCSNLIAYMIDKKLIKKTRFKKTFLLEALNGNDHDEKKDVPIVEKIKVDSISVPEMSNGDGDKKTKVDSAPSPEIVSRGDHKKKRDTSLVKQEILGMLPVLQSDMWKKLCIGRGYASTLVDAMLKDGLIKRTKEDKTFLLEKAGETICKKEKGFSVLLRNSKFSPCCGCTIECDPRTCHILTEWLM